jgi:hypothetical protein
MLKVKFAAACLGDQLRRDRVVPAAGGHRELPAPVLARRVRVELVEKGVALPREVLKAGVAAGQLLQWRVLRIRYFLSRVLCIKFQDVTAVLGARVRVELDL